MVDNEKSNQENQDCNGNQKNAIQGLRPDGKTNTTKNITNNTYKATRVNEQFGQKTGSSFTTITTTN